MYGSVAGPIFEQDLVFPISPVTRKQCQCVLKTGRALERPQVSQIPCPPCWGQGRGQEETESWEVDFQEEESHQEEILEMLRCGFGGWHLSHLSMVTLEIGADTQEQVSNLVGLRHRSPCPRCVHYHEKTSCLDVNLSWVRFINALTDCVSVLLSCNLLLRAFLLPVSRAPPPMRRRFLLLGAASSGEGKRSGNACWRSSRCSFSRISFWCLERVLSATSRPPLQRVGHVHQTIGRCER